MEENNLKLRTKYEKSISDFLKSFFDYEYKNNTLLFDNLPTFFDLIVFLIDNIEEFVLKDKRPIDFNKVSSASISEKITLLQNFYNYIKVPFDINDVINNGSLDIKTISLEEAIEKNLIFRGFCEADKKTNHTSINVHNTDLITDLFVWVHEITHYRNMTPKANEINHPLTEAISFTYELIMLDYLSSEGYTYEAATYQYEFIRNAHAFLYQAYYTVKLFNLYNSLGDITIDNYKTLYGYDDDYDKCLETFLEVICENNKAIFNELWYSLAFALSTYMYIEFEKDPSFITSIESLNERIKSKSISECLQTIHLTGYNEESLDKIEQNLELFKEEITDGNDFILTKIAQINDYFIELIKLYYEEKSLLFDHTNDFYFLISFLLNELRSFFKNRVPHPEIDKLTLMNKEEKINLIKDYYHYMQRADNISDILNHTKITSFNMEEGIIDGDPSLLIRASLSGYTTNENEGKEVGLTETNLLLDSCAWVHEFKHYNNLPNHLRSTESYILTEAVSFTDELIYADFLQKMGYQYDGSFIKYETLNNFYIFLLDAYPFEKLLSIFTSEGELSKQGYQKHYKEDDDFEDNLEEALTLLSDDADDFKNYLRYSVACAISIYLYEMYKEDPSFITKINEFESSINDHSFYDCLRIIGLSGLDKESLAKVTKAFKKYEKELNELITNKTLKLFDMKYEKVL